MSRSRHNGCGRKRCGICSQIDRVKHKKAKAAADTADLYAQLRELRGFNLRALRAPKDPR